ncbi:hypothetical protein, partial [uncultured Gimesia sp.]|uniref:hypothetical protein n=1 Tax=uncultured Gimesia sp. TaxID=1678688 RepID=UPI0026387F45
ATKFGHIELRGWFKYMILGGILGLIIGYFLGAGILAPILAQNDPNYGFLRSKIVASYTSLFLIIGMPFSGIVGGSLGVIYGVIQRRQKPDR